MKMTNIRYEILGFHVSVPIELNLLGGLDKVVLDYDVIGVFETLGAAIDSHKSHVEADEYEYVILSVAYD